MDNKINPYITYALKRPLPLNQKNPTTTTKHTISQINAMMNKKLKANISQTCFDK